MTLAFARQRPFKKGFLLGKDASLSERSVPESKSNKCDVSSHRHDGVREVAMLRSVIETSREILAAVVVSKMIKTPNLQTTEIARGWGAVRKSEGFIVALKLL